MTISYPITLPATPGFRRITWGGLSGAGVTISPFTGSQQVQATQAQLWRGSVDLPPMSRAQAAQWFSALLSLQGQFGTFMFGDPAWKTPQGLWAGIPVVNGAGQIGSTLAISGLTVGTTIKAGDYLQISSGASARLHQALADATADGSGLATIDIWPRHRSSPGSGDPITTASPKGIFRLGSGEIARSAEPFVFGVSFDVVEAF